MVRSTDCRQVRGEPLPHLLHEVVGVLEQAIDQIDHLAIEALEPRRKPLADDLWRVSAWIMNRNLFRQLSLRKLWSLYTSDLLANYRNKDRKCNRAWNEPA